MSDPDLGKISAALAGAVEARVVAVVEEEPESGRLGDLLGEVLAATALTRNIAEVERRILRSERDKDALRAQLNDASRDDANRIKERIDALDGHAAALEGQRAALTNSLAALADVLGS